MIGCGRIPGNYSVVAQKNGLEIAAIYDLVSANMEGRQLIGRTLNMSMNVSGAEKHIR